MSDSSSGSHSDVENDGIIADLTPQQSEKVRNFLEFCGTDNPEIAKTCLEQCNWDLEVSVQEFLNEREGRPSVFSQEGQENQANMEQEIRRRHVGAGGDGPSNLAERLRPVGTVQRRRLGGQPVGWIQWCYSLFALPFRFVYTTFFDLIRFLWGFFVGGRRRLAVTDPEGDVRNFIAEFESTYGAVHPKFEATSYSAALSTAKTELKFLLVYLHSPSHQDTDRFCAETLGDPDLIQFVDQNMMFWACSVKLPEGARVSQALRETTYPFLALICLRDNRMAMTLRQEGFCLPGDMMAFLAVAVQDNETYLRAARSEREARQFNQLLRQEQETAFEETLLADKEKQERKLEEERKKEEEERELERQEQMKIRMKEEFEARKEDIRRNLAPEPDSDESDAIVRVSLKYPSGTRTERKFLGSESMEALYNVALIHPECPDNFSLVTNFPRRELNCRPQWVAEFWAKYGKSVSKDSDFNERIQNFNEADLGKAVMIFVQDNEA